MIRKRHPWIVRVHASMLASKAQLSAAEICQLYGRPDGKTAVAMRMANAKKSGWFTAGRRDGCPQICYTAEPKEQTPNKNPPQVRHDKPRRDPGQFEGIGRGFPRVSSVFDLGALP